MKRRPRTRVPRTVPPGQLRRTVEAIRRLRTHFVFGSLLVLFLVLLGRLAKLQIVDADHYRALARSRHQGGYSFDAQRGRIVDRFGRVLAQSRPLRRVSVDPHPDVLTDPQVFALRVARVLENSPPAQRIRQIIEQEQAVWRSGRKGRRYIVLRASIEDPLLIGRLDTIRALSVNQKQRRKIWGLIVERGEVREYPNDRYAYHVLGKIPTDADSPPFGIEGHFNDYLSGCDHRVRVVRDGHRRIMAAGERVCSDAYRGGDVKLTLDIVVQHQLEQALDEVVRAWQPTELCGLVMDPLTGDVLAWANRPAQNGNLAEDEQGPIATGGYDYVSRGLYEVGSVFKPFTVAWALERGVVRADDEFEMPAQRLFDGCKKVIHDTHHVGRGTVVRLIEQSSNTGAAFLAELLGPEGMRAMWTHLGLGQRPEIEFPGARGGRENYDVRKYKLKRWPVWLSLRMGFGQGNVITPLQLASLYCALARDDARVVKPSIVFRAKPRDPRGPRLCDPRYLPVIRQGLCQVVTSGTARALPHTDYPLAGKTGTSQQPGDMNVCTFAGFAPADDPKLVCLVLATVPREKQGSGGTVAGPAVARVLDQALAYLRVPTHRLVLSAPTSPERSGPSAVAGPGGVLLSPTPATREEDR